MLKRHSQGSRYVRFSPSCVVVLVVENLFLLSSRPPQSVCSLRLGASSPLSECQAFQHIWQCSFSLRIQAGDIKCRRHTLTDVHLLHTRHTPVCLFPVKRHKASPRFWQGSTQTPSGHCPRMSPCAPSLEFSELSIVASVLFLAKGSSLQMVEGCWAADPDPKEPCKISSVTWWKKVLKSQLSEEINLFE